MWLTKRNLPTTVTVNDKTYRLNTDFRAWITFESVMIDSVITEDLKPYFMVSAVINDYEEVNEQLLHALFSFYRMDKPLRQTSTHSSELGYRYDYDMDLILAAFRQQYGIDLLTADMHWWEFKSLFDSLTDQTKFIQVVGYRTADISKMDKEQKKHYQELKKFYALPKEKTQDRSQEDLEKMLMENLKGGEV